MTTHQRNEPFMKNAKTPASIVIALTIILSASPAAAGSFMYGDDSTIHHLQDVSLTDPNGEPLYLGYMTNIFFLGLGVFVTDEGYVLGIRGNKDSFYELPSGNDLEALQAAGMLPTPLPPYRLELMDYLIGYSLWLLIAGSALFQAIRKRFFRRDRNRSTETPH